MLVEVGAAAVRTGTGPNRGAGWAAAGRVVEPRRLGWVLLAATCVFVGLQALMLAASGYPMLSRAVLIDEAFPLVPIGAVVGAAVGALIVSRYPRNRVGWLFCVGQLGNAIGLAAQAFVVLVGQGRIDAPFAGLVAVYVANLFDATYTIAFLAVIFMIAPTGRLLSRRWRYAVAVPIAAVVVNAAVILTLPAENLQPGRPAEAGAVALALLIGSGVALLVSVVLGAVALWVRLRRSTGDERRQLRWIATSAAVLAGTFVLLGVGNLVLGFESWVVLEALYLAYIGVFVSVGIAILWYRLYDIDVILSRAIVLAVLAVFVTVGYVGVVVAIGSVLAAAGTAVSGVFWPSLVATALVAAAFQPVRRHVLHLADRLVYGEQAAPYEALADLSRRLADSPSPEQLPARVAEAAGRALGAARTRVRLGTDNDPSAGLIADWPTDPPAGDLPTADTGADPGSPTVELPVVDRGDHAAGPGPPRRRALATGRLRRTSRGGVPEHPAEDRVDRPD